MNAQENLIGASIEQSARIVAMDALLRALVRTHPAAALLLQEYQRMLADNLEILRDTGFEENLSHQGAKELAERIQPYATRYQESIEERVIQQQ